MKEIVFGAVIAIACAVIAIFICIGLGDQLVRHVSPVHHTNQNQTANNTPADTQVMISRRSSSDISRGPMLQSGQRAMFETLTGEEIHRLLKSRTPNREFVIPTGFD